MIDEFLDPDEWKIQCRWLMSVYNLWGDLIDGERILAEGVRAVL